jgi:hypothetical protein
MDPLQDRLDQIKQQQAQIETIDEVYRTVREQRKDIHSSYRATVTEALETLQQEIDEPIPLLQVQERGRLSFDYQEALTEDGVVTEDGGFHDWDGAISVNEYLDKPYRGTGEHYDLLVERMDDLKSEDVPTIQYPVPS